MTRSKDKALVCWFEELGARDVPIVGGKNASLGEMFNTLKQKGIRVTDGFATTAKAYWEFLEYNSLLEPIQGYLGELERGELTLEQTGKTIRRLILRARFPEELSAAIHDAYKELNRRFNAEHVDVAVRSSATAEDLPTASFAGQQETFLNNSGDTELLEACRK